MKTHCAFFNEADSFQQSSLSRVYGENQLNRLKERALFHPVVVNSRNFAAQLPEIQNVAAIFSTWGMPALSEEQIAQLPSLKAVFYGAGSVQWFARPFLNRGIIVASGWAANAVPVAEYTFAEIIFSLKRGWSHLQVIHEVKGPAAVRQQSAGVVGAYGAVIGLIGMGMIGRLVVERLKSLNVKTLVYDPYMSPELCQSMGVESVTLEEIFSRSDVVSLHAPNIPATKGMITGAHFAAMKPHTTFLNTARGALVREDEMVAVLKERTDIFAVLDVTDPEPPVEGSPLYLMPNIVLTPHIAGSLGDECRRMADYVIDEFEAWQQGRPLRYSVSLEMLQTMA